ncbi:hypothetical protein EPA93_14720 [Ktedonosporobacter rubrisoli]|uniref:Condensation domain-containing protein n=1 Tax=Ktedonosporobacter rubrisoli TaxID=2509675 RepID=A0A4P6JPN5_KTERU|nr:condensation domain-containing protein [Ktedonosporobacter rubrisoli]QBD77183.1 hypothetical protein EPA93_14720 [Ktedonosporobacter rubrisoli]
MLFPSPLTDIRRFFYSSKVVPRLPREVDMHYDPQAFDFSHLAKEPISEEIETYTRYSNLTQLQLSYWIMQKLQPKMSIHSIANCFVIDGEVDVRHFQQAFQVLVNASDTLRLIILEQDGIPQQYIAPYRAYDIDVIDCSSSPDPFMEFQKAAARRFHKLFDFSHRLFDSALFKLSNQKYVWYFNEHHIIGDAWSRTVLYRRMLELYELSLQHKLHCGKTYPQFSQYLLHEMAFRSSLEYKKARQYWEKKLSNGNNVGLFSQKRHYKLTGEMCWISYQPGKERVERVKALAREQKFAAFSIDMALFVVYLSLLFLCLYHITGQRCLSLFTIFHRRQSQQFQETMGLLTKESVIQLRIEEEDTFLSLLAKTTTEVIETLTHYRYSVLNPPTTRHQTVYFVTQNSSYHPQNGFGTASIRNEFLAEGYSYESLCVEIENFNQLAYPAFNFYFRTDMFEPEEQQQIIRQFEQTIDTFLENPLRTVG